MMSICLTWVPFGGLGEPNIYLQSVCFTRKWEGNGVSLVGGELFPIKECE